MDSLDVAEEIIDHFDAKKVAKKPIADRSNQWQWNSLPIQASGHQLKLPFKT